MVSNVLGDVLAQLIDAREVLGHPSRRRRGFPSEGGGHGQQTHRLHDLAPERPPNGRAQPEAPGRSDASPQANQFGLLAIAPALSGGVTTYFFVNTVLVSLAISLTSRKPIASSGAFDAAKAEVSTYKLVGPEYFNFFALVMSCVALIFIFVAVLYREKTHLRDERQTAAA